MRIFNLRLLWALSLCLILLNACGGNVAHGVNVWIDAPVDGLILPSTQPIIIEGHATSPGGVSRVEIWLDGKMIHTIDRLSTTGNLAGFQQEWTPPGPGKYVIQAVAFDSGGLASSPDSTRIVFGRTAEDLPDLAITSVEAVVAGYKDTVPFCNTRVVYTNVGTAAVPGDFAIQFSFDGVPRWTSTFAGGLAPGASGEAEFVYQFTEMHYLGINLDSDNAIAESNEGNNAFAAARICGTPTPIVTITPTITPTVPPSMEPVVEFVADPPEIQAGACTTLRWHAENVQRLILGGIEQPLDGTYKDCLCKTERFTLTIVHLDGRQEKRPVTITVKGVCVTPGAPGENNPPAENGAPSAPVLVVPANGLSLSCRGSQNLVWLPVNGAAEYQVQVQRHSGNGNWKDVPGSVFTGISGKEHSIPVECGWYYRWQVRAIGASGAASPWSGWRQFTVTLE